MGKKIQFYGTLLLFVILFGCGGKTASRYEIPPFEITKNTATFFAMGTVMELTVYGKQPLLEQAETRAKELESLFSVTDSGSEIYTVNHNGTAALSADTAALDLSTWPSSGLPLKSGGTQPPLAD